MTVCTCILKPATPIDDCPIHGLSTVQRKFRDVASEVLDHAARESARNFDAKIISLALADKEN